MSRRFQKVRDEALDLSIEERSWLAEQLWDSARTAREQKIDASWMVEVERRLKEIEDGTATLIPAEEVFRELRAKDEAESWESRHRVEASLTK